MTEHRALKNSRHSTKYRDVRAFSDWMPSLVFCRARWKIRRVVERIKKVAMYLRTKGHRGRGASCTAHRLKIANFSRRITRCIKLSPEVNFAETFGLPAQFCDELRASQSERDKVRIDLKFLRQFYYICSIFAREAAHINVRTCVFRSHYV